MITLVISSILSLPLADSYEMQILDSMGLKTNAKSLIEVQAEFEEQGLVIEHQEIHRDLMIFKDFSELKDWIRTQVPREDLVENFLALMQEKGWIDLGEGKIAFPKRTLWIKAVK